MEESFSTRKLLSGAELKELNTKSDLAGALQLGSHVGAILVLGYLHYLAMGSWWVIATGFCLGVTVNFLYAAQHELSHWTVFRTRYLNELFGRTVGFLMMFPRDYDMAMHQAHHRWTAQWERDGELTRTQKVRRSFIADRYAPLIEALYDGSSEKFVETEVTYEDGRKGSISATVRVARGRMVCGSGRGTGSEISTGSAG